MPLFEKKDEHAGSGLDKPDPKSLKEKVSDALKAIVPGSQAPKTEPTPPLAPTD